jgi:hypothetical protein
MLFIPPRVATQPRGGCDRPAARSAEALRPSSPSICTHGGRQSFRRWNRTSPARTPDPNGGLRAYEQLFPELPPPRSIQSWQSDGYFAYQRLNGPNPMVIPATGAGGRAPESLLGHRRPLPTRSLVSGAHSPTRSAKGESSWPTTICSHRRKASTPFPIRPTRRESARPRGTWPAPFGLVLVESGREAASRRSRSSSSGFRARRTLSTRAMTTRTLWLRAKTFFQISDLNHHELSTHLCRAQPGARVFPVATARPARRHASDSRAAAAPLRGDDLQQLPGPAAPPQPPLARSRGSSPLPWRNRSRSSTASVPSVGLHAAQSRDGASRNGA